MTGTNEVFNTLLNLDQCGKRRRDEGRALAAEHRAHTLKHAQQIARRLSDHDQAGVRRGWYKTPRGVTIDDVREAMQIAGETPNNLGNAAGSVFSGKGWRRIDTVQSTRPCAHARWIGVWRYDPEGSTDVTEAHAGSAGFIPVPHGTHPDKMQANLEYWFKRCVLQEQALDACLVATVGPRKGAPATHSEITYNAMSDEANGVDTGWDGPNTFRLIEKALDARRMKS